MDKYKKVANSIKNTYESNLFTLELKYQLHFSQRMYRISGEKKYIQPIVNAHQVTKVKIEYFLKNCDNQSYITKESNVLLKKTLGSSQKDVYRKKIFSNRYKEFLFFADIILRISNWQSFNIKKESRDKAINVLKKVKFKKYFIDCDFIRYYGTQLINVAYDLKKIKISNHISDFTTRFKEIFMNVKDETLEDFEYQNKIYGLTHFIITESDYYQKFVSLRKNKWILDYFYGNINQIIRRTNADIIAEVGLCFMLCRDTRGKILKTVRNFLVKEFDNNLGYIPRGNKKELSISEHTNIIAYIVLSGFDKLYKGHDLSQYFK